MGKKWGIGELRIKIKKNIYIFIYIPRQILFSTIPKKIPHFIPHF